MCEHLLCACWSGFCHLSPQILYRGGVTTISDAEQVMGIITRKDIAEANAKLALGRKATLGLTTPSERLVRHGTLPFIPYGAYDPTVGYSSSR